MYIIMYTTGHTYTQNQFTRGKCNMKCVLHIWSIRSQATQTLYTHSVQMGSGHTKSVHTKSVHTGSGHTKSVQTESVHMGSGHKKCGHNQSTCSQSTQMGFIHTVYLKKPHWIVRVGYLKIN